MSVIIAASVILGGCGARESGPTPPGQTVAVVAPTATALAPSVSTPATPSAAPPARVNAASAGAPQQSPMTLSEAIGQRLVTGFQGPEPPREILRAVRSGRLGGIILFADNLRGPDGARQLIARLQSTARAGGRPPLLIMVDQEGGDVKRLPAAPPARSPAEMGASANVVGEARSAGVATARALRALGINVDLAPVADVAVDDGSFLGTRAFGRTPAVVAAGACGFADGLRQGGVAATLKHFPGLGRAHANTDERSTTIAASAGSLRRDLAAYRRCGDSVALVMLSSAVYPALDPGNPAVLSPATHRLLADLGFTGLTISDAFDTPAIAPRRHAASRALRAGVDLLLYGQSGRGALVTYDRTLAEARIGRLGRSDLIETARRIVTLKRRLIGAGR